MLLSIQSESEDVETEHKFILNAGLTGMNNGAGFTGGSKGGGANGAKK